MPNSRSVQETLANLTAKPNHRRRATLSMDFPKGHKIKPAATAKTPARMRVPAESGHNRLSRTKKLVAGGKRKGALKYGEDFGQSAKPNSVEDKDDNVACSRTSSIHAASNIIGESLISAARRATRKQKQKVLAPEARLTNPFNHGKILFDLTLKPIPGNFLLGRERLQRRDRSFSGLSWDKFDQNRVRLASEKMKSAKSNAVKSSIYPVGSRVQALFNGEWQVCKSFKHQGL